MNGIVFRHMARLLFAVLLGGLVPGAGMAAQLEKLYEAQIPVLDQAAKTRKKGLRDALAEVLVRVSGDRAVLEQPAITSLLAQPGRYVQQFGYRPSPEDGAQVPWLLWVRFDAAGLERTLRERGLPFWGQERPETLVWIAVEQRGRREVIAEPEKSAVKNWLHTAAVRRGLPLIFPLMDLEDSREVKFTDVWGGFMGTLHAASRRYRPQAILVGRVHQGASGGWSATWSLHIQGSEKRWSASDNRLSAVTAEGIDWAADQLAAVFAVSYYGVPDQAVSVAVEGVLSLTDYARSHAYLSRLSTVETVQLVQLTGGRAEYRVELQGDIGSFERALAFGGVLVPDNEMGERVYRLQP